MVRLPGNTDTITVAEDGMRNSDRPAGLVESPVLSNGHAGFGRRAEETDRSKDRHRASSRPHDECLYLQARGELRTQLKIALRQGRTCRVSRSRTVVARGKIRDDQH
jgi:endo-1,4-beta-D-glucanase Y